MADLSGIKPIVNDMCLESCIAFTGPFSKLESCPKCSEPKYDQFCLEASSGAEKIPRQEFRTISIEPQIQALYRNPESVKHAHYLREERSKVLAEIEQHGSLRVYNDILHGLDIIEAFQDGRIGEDDIILMFSIDGAQLYAEKASAC